MSPEQAVGRAADTRSDLWAFGVVLQEMLTGRAAFAGTTDAKVLGLRMSGKRLRWDLHATVNPIDCATSLPVCRE